MAFQIKDIVVGDDNESLVIAEIGINHEGSLKVAMEMVDAAARAGIKIVKHQTHIPEDEMLPIAKTIKPGNSDDSIYSIMERCALSEEEERALMEYVEEKEMIFISTPFSRAAALRLENFGVPAYKIGSGECDNYPLLKLVASFGKPIILSTGMNNLPSVERAVRILEDAGVSYGILHTTNLYPTPDHLVRLGAMVDLKDKFPNAVVGLSDHTLTNHACFAACALGGSIFERHFTDRMDRAGPDIVCSMDEQACRELIEGLSLIKLQRGGHKNCITDEQITRDFASASVCTTKDVKKGEIFSEENLWVRRPGVNGIAPIHYEAILGLVAERDLAANSQLQSSDIRGSYE